MNNILIFAIIGLSVIIMARMINKSHEQSKVYKEEVAKLNKTVAKLDKKNEKITKKLVNIRSEGVSNVASHEHVVMINSDQNEFKYEFPYKLKNVKHVEVISAIIPKSEYRINEYNNTFKLDSATFTIPEGAYSDVITLLMEINQLLYDGSTDTVFAYDANERNIVIMGPPGTVVDFTVNNSIGALLGFENETYTIPIPDTSNEDSIVSSLQYFYNLKTQSAAGSRPINNLPAANYTFTSQFASGAGVITVDAVWRYVFSPNRVNMKHQLYVDVDLDEVTYWDGTHRLVRVYIPEEKEEAEYTSYGKPILRSMNERYIDLDKLTFRVFSVVNDTNRHPYDLNGLFYSLQVQITTIDPILT